MSTERTRIEIDRQAEELLDQLAGKVSVVKEGEKIIVIPEALCEAESSASHEGSETVHYSLFLTPKGLIEKRSYARYISDLIESGGKPESEDNREYPTEPSSVLIKHYSPDEDNIKALELVLQQLQSRIKA